MKILMLTWEYPPNKVGGVASHAEDLSRCLSRKGHDISVVTFGQEEKTEVRDGVEVHRVTAGHADDVVTWSIMLNQEMQKKASEVLAKEKFDLLHAHDWSSVQSAVSLKKATGLPLVFSLHSTERGRVGIHSDMSKLINDLEWYGTYEADEVITVGEDLKKEIMHHFSVPEEKVSHIPNGVYASKFEKGDSIRDRIALDWEKPVLFVGRLCHQKGVRHLIDSMPLVLDKRPETKFIVAGGSDEAAEHYRRMAQDRGAGEKAYFTGYVPDEKLINLYNSVHATVMPSLYEPFGITALESMASGTPVVGSRVGGIKETVVHEWSGLHVNPGDPGSIAWGIDMTLSDQTWNRWMGKNGRKRVKEKYTWKKTANSTKSVYENALDS